jgi:hypothetical protein
LAQPPAIGLDIPGEGEAAILLHHRAGRQHPGDQLAGLAVAGMGGAGDDPDIGLAGAALAHGIGGARQLGHARCHDRRLGGMGLRNLNDRTNKQKSGQNDLLHAQITLPRAPLRSRHSATP